MTNLFQLLTVNKLAKNFSKKIFLEWFSRQISIGLENGQELEDVEIEYCLSVLKPLHAMCLISFYDYTSSSGGKAVIASGWKKLGIFDAVELGLSTVLDPFNDIYLLMEITPQKETLSLASLFPEELESYKTKIADETDEDESEWEVDDADEDSDTDDEYDHDVRNAFDMFRDEKIETFQYFLYIEFCIYFNFPV